MAAFSYTPSLARRHHRRHQPRCLRSRVELYKSCALSMADLDGGAGARGGTCARARARAPTPPPPEPTPPPFYHPRETINLNFLNFKVLKSFPGTKFQVHVLILKSRC